MRRGSCGVRLRCCGARNCSAGKAVKVGSPDLRSLVFRRGGSLMIELLHPNPPGRGTDAVVLDVFGDFERCMVGRAQRIAVFSDYSPSFF